MFSRPFLEKNCDMEYVLPTGGWGIRSSGKFLKVDEIYILYRFLFQILIFRAGFNFFRRSVLLCIERFLPCTRNPASPQLSFPCTHLNCQRNLQLEVSTLSINYDKFLNCNSLGTLNFNNFAKFLNISFFLNTFCVNKINRSFQFFFGFNDKLKLLLARSEMCTCVHWLNKEIIPYLHY